MKKKLLAIAVLAILAVPIHGQESQTTLGKFSLEINMTGSYAYHNIKEIGINENLGYEFVPNLQALAHYESTVGLYDDDNTKTHFSSNALGGGLAYKFMKSTDGGSVDARFIVAQTIGGCDWKKTVYDAGIQWKMRGGLSPTMSLGFRHENSHTTGIPNMNIIYGSIGIRL